MNTTQVVQSTPSATPNPLDPGPVSSDTLLLVGPIFVGCLISYLLFGISVMQLYLYHINYRDNWIIKISVYTIFALDIFQSVASAAMGWHALCTGWGRPIALTRPGWTFSAIPAVSGIVAAWVQIFYAYRIHVLGKWRIVPVVICTVALAQASGALAIAIGFVPLKDVEKLHATNMYARTIVWLGGAAFSDILISISMLYLLYSARHSSASVRSTQRIINRLIRLTIETGIVTATSASLELILFQTFPSNNLHVFVALMLCKVYSNAFMTSLNSRASYSADLQNPTAPMTTGMANDGVKSWKFATRATADIDREAVTTGSDSRFGIDSSRYGTITPEPSTVVVISTTTSVDDTRGRSISERKLNMYIPEAYNLDMEMSPTRSRESKDDGLEVKKGDDEFTAI